MVLPVVVVDSSCIGLSMDISLISYIATIFRRINKSNRYFWGVPVFLSITVVVVLFTVYCYKGSQRSYKNTTYTIHYSQYLYIPKAECIPAFLEDTCSLSQCRNSSNRWHF